MAAKTSSPASAFTKVLRSFETGGFTCLDVVAELKRLLKAGASPTELSEILRRREFVEPLPVDAHKEVLGLLDAAKERAAAEAIDQQVEGAVASAKTTIRIVPPPRIPDPIPTPESKLVTAPVQMPAGRATRTPTRARGSPSAVTSPKPSPAADGLGDVVVRAITLARTSASPARTSALPDSARRKIGRTAPGRAGVAAPTRGTAPIPTLIPPAEKPVTDGKPAQVELQELDDWSDLAILREDLTADPVADGNARKGRRVLPRGSLVRVIGWIAAVLGLAAIAWFRSQ